MCHVRSQHGAALAAASLALLAVAGPIPESLADQPGPHRVEIDMQMKRQMLEKAEAPTVNKAPEWQKPGILEWLNRVARSPELCEVAC